MLSRILIVTLLGAVLPVSSGAGPELISVSPRSAILRTIDAADGSTLDSSVVISMSGEIVLGATGLARDPQTGTVYALLKLLGVSTRELVTLDVETGDATSVGNTSDKFATIAFGGDGTLYGITGDGATTPQSLYRLSTADATKTLLTGFGVPEEGVTDGEALAFNPADGQLYRGSGIGAPNIAEIFERIDPGTLTIVNVPLSGFDYEELTALLYLGGQFYAADLGDPLVDMPQLVRITPAGAVSFVGDLDHISKGLIHATFTLPEPQPVPSLPQSALIIVIIALILTGAPACALQTPDRGARKGDLSSDQLAAAFRET
jgi:hypothetical protein